MVNAILRKAAQADIPALTEASRLAFNTDFNFGGEPNDGPPGYDSESWMRKMLKNTAALWCDGKIVGGAILFFEKNEPEVLNVGRIFVAPEYHHKGLGLELMRLVEGIFEDKTCFRLETPVWNERTNRFYIKAGYTEVSRDKESVYYQKRL